MFGDLLADQLNPLAEDPATGEPLPPAELGGHMGGEPTQALGIAFVSPWPRPLSPAGILSTDEPGNAGPTYTGPRAPGSGSLTGCL